MGILAGAFAERMEAEAGVSVAPGSRLEATAS